MFAASIPLFNSTCKRSSIFTRYAFAVQYHGGNFLGFVYQGRRGENCIVYRNNIAQSDLRGIESVEGRIRRALDKLVGCQNYTNIQVSSRTDRGVHAWRNTFSVDIKPRFKKVTNKDGDDRTNEQNHKKINPTAWCPKKLTNGLNYYLTRLSNYPESDDSSDCNNENDVNGLHKLSDMNIPSNNNSIRILSSSVAPEHIRTPNERYDPSLPEDESTNPKSFPWDVRFTATRRTYAYRILHSHDSSNKEEEDSTQQYASACYYSQPFENDRCWRIHAKETRKNRDKPKRLDINAMNEAAQHLVGTHDFTSFRGNGCERSSPIVTLEDISISKEKYHNENESGGVLSAVWRRKMHDKENVVLPELHTHESLHLVTIVITGKSFLYHQVRNMVACLVDVGSGRLTPNDVKDILEKKDRSIASGMAPPQGLFLVDVEHGEFDF